MNLFNKIQKVIIHRCFLKDSIQYGDIALIKTTKKIEFGPKVNAVCLPQKNEEEPLRKKLKIEF